VLCRRRLTGERPVCPARVPNLSENDTKAGKYFSGVDQTAQSSTSRRDPGPIGIASDPKSYAPRAYFMELKVRIEVTVYA
jgi:hypothetical protein